MYKKGELKHAIPNIGSTFGYWEVIDNELFMITKGHWGIKCQCKCGTISYVRVSALVKGVSNGCPCRAFDRMRDMRNYVGDLGDTLWGRILKSARLRDLPVDITKEYVWDLYLKQDKKCALSGLDIVIEKSISRKKGRNNITASLDRIDSSQGYLKGNVQWVHKHINLMKQNLNEDLFKNLCKAVTNFENLKNL